MWRTIDRFAEFHVKPIRLIATRIKAALITELTNNVNNSDMEVFPKTVFQNRQETPRHHKH